MRFLAAAIALPCDFFADSVAVENHQHCWLFLIIAILPIDISKYTQEHALFLDDTVMTKANIVIEITIFGASWGLVNAR